MSDASLALTHRYLESLVDLSPADQARCNEALRKYSANPDTPGLRLAPLKGASDRWKIRAAQHLRIVLDRIGDLSIVLLAGHRKDVYDRAQRMKVIFNLGTQAVRIIETDEATAGQRTPVRQPEPRETTTRGIMDHWTDADLAAAGFTDTEIAELRGCHSEDQLLELDGFGWSDERIELTIDLLSQTPEEWQQPSLMEDHVMAGERIRAAVETIGALHGLSQLLTPDDLADLATAPIEEWMLFLHPDQASVARATYQGPARVRGGVGTGKTVVSIHRAASLARRYSPDRVLFTTYVNSLPPVFEALYNRLPGSPDNIDFVNVDRLAWQLCAKSGHTPVVDTNAVRAAWAAAWRARVKPGTPLARERLSRAYVSEEITRVIKGLGITTLDDYLKVDRRGRQTPLRAPERTQIWELRGEWDGQMQERGTVDFADVILRAAVLAEELETPPYRAAIIDEAQDLTLSGLRFVRHLVRGSDETSPDRLFLSGDAGQRIYAGGFTLSQAGLEVRGRSTVLRTSYRSTAQILDAAFAVAGDRRVADMEEEYVRAAEAAVTARTGLKPVVLESSPDLQYQAVAAGINSLVESGALSLGDIGVFAPTNKKAGDVEAALKQLGLPVRSLASYAGVSTSEVKVGTFHRAKGLEFKVVFLTGLDTTFPRSPGPSLSQREYQDYLDLAISTLFVAMTRARDLLYVVCSSEPSVVIDKARNSFDWASNLEGREVNV